MDQCRTLFSLCLPLNTENKCSILNSPMTVFEPRTSGSKATALPTEPQPLLYIGIDQVT